MTHSLPPVADLVAVIDAGVLTADVGLVVRMKLHGAARRGATGSNP